MTENEIITILRSFGGSIECVAGKTGPNAFGVSLQTALGIKHSTKNRNSIGRFLINGTTQNFDGNGRTNLFARVADWQSSYIKSSKELLNLLGTASQEGANGRSLNCTVGAEPKNNFNLELRVDYASEILWEVLVESDGSEQKLLSWPFAILEKKLEDRLHPQIIIEAKKVPGHFLLKRAHVFDNPKPQLFFNLILDGAITLDHLISEEKLGGSVTEKGPLFKVRNGARARLYELTTTHSL